MNAYVTGAPGWLGTRLVEALFQGLPDSPSLSPLPRREVRCLVRPGTDTTALARAEIVEGDLRDPEAAERFLRDGEGGTVFHSAGVIHPTRGIREFYDVNVEGTKRLLEAAEKHGLRRFIYVSSNSPIGVNPAPGEQFDERAPYRPYMNYGRSKMLAEQAVKAAEQRGELETVIIRPPWFYGPNQPDRQTLFFSMIRQGKFPLVGEGHNRRSMAFIDNICQGLLLCERAPEARGQTYWIADRKPYSMTEIIATVEDVMERDFGVTPARQRMKLPAIASEVAFGMDSLLQAVGLYHQKVHVLSEMNKTIACDVGKAERELGYDPKVDLAEGMRRSMEWMKQQGIAW